VLLHGNGGNIEGMKYQIDYFSKNYRVIAMDCRGRGKLELGKDTLTYIIVRQGCYQGRTYIIYLQEYTKG